MSIKGWAITAGLGAAAGAVAVLMVMSFRKHKMENLFVNQIVAGEEAAETEEAENTEE